MAVMLHFSVCEWGLNGYEESSCIVPFLPFVQAREQFAAHHSGLPITYNTMAAGLWGLVIPLGLVVAGISLILRDPRPTIIRTVGGWLHRAGRWLRKWAAVFIAGVAVTVALLAGILLLHHSGRDVVPAPGTADLPGWLSATPPHSGRDVTSAPVDWEKELADVPVLPGFSGIFQKYEQLSGEELASRIKWETSKWLKEAELAPENTIHEPQQWLRQRSARQWSSKKPENLSNTIAAFRVQFPNESWTKEREQEYREFLATDAFDEIAKVALRKGSSEPVWTPADIKRGIPPPPDYKGLNSADWTPETGIPPPPDAKKMASAPIQVEVDGYGTIEFPACMTEQEIHEVLHRHFPAAQKPPPKK
jgi:hypothetical protein